MTLGYTPATSDEWRLLLQRLFDGLRAAGFIRWHWVVEWQARGTPHLHMAVYGPEEGLGGWQVVRVWLRLTKDAYGSQIGSQKSKPITDAVGWSKYCAKHAARGVRHYQRWGRPDGWEKTGRLWGYGGDWPTTEPVVGHLSTAEYHQVRRMVRNWAVAEARTRALGHESRALRYEGRGEREKARQEREKAGYAWDSVGYLRRLFKCPDRSLSTVRGLSQWVPGEGHGDVFVRMCLWAGWQGELVEASAAA